MTTEELTKKVFELDESLTRHSEQLKTAFNQIVEIKNISEGVHKLATSMELLTREQMDMGKKVDSLVEDVDEIKEKPIKRWDSLTNIVLSVIVTAVVTYFVTKLGL